MPLKRKKTEGDAVDKVNACLKNFCIIFFILALAAFAYLPDCRAQDDAGRFKTLRQRLIDDDFDKKLISRIFDDPAVKFDIKGVSAYFRHREALLDYGQFLSEESIKSAREYMDAHGEKLSKTENEYGVDKTVITAIMLVETRLGRYVGSRPVINTLATMAVLSDPSARKNFWRKMPDDIDISREKFRKKAELKSRWAYRELKAFIEHVENEGLNAHKINGSYAGALGIAQFMPSNILLYAKDGNHDGRVDLFDHADAIASIANYLKRHGWEPGMDREAEEDVIYHYNHSSYYVDTILEISKKLKG